MEMCCDLDLESWAVPCLGGEGSRHRDEVQRLQVNRVKEQFRWERKVRREKDKRTKEGLDLRHFKLAA